MKGFIKFYGYLKRDFLLLIKRKKYFYLSLAVPFIIGLLFIAMLNPSTANIKVGVCDFDDTEYSRQAVTDLNGFDTILLSQQNCIETMTEMIQSGEIPVGIEIEEGFSSKIENLEQALINVYYDGTDIALSNLISWKVDVALIPFKRGIVNQLNEELKHRVGAARVSVDLAKGLPLTGTAKDQVEEIDNNLRKVEEVDTEFLVNPVWSAQKPLFEQENQKGLGIAFVFPIISLFMILMLSSVSLIYDRKTNFLIRVKASTSPLIYLLAKLVFFYALTLVQFVVLIGIFLLSGATFKFNPLGVFELIGFVAVINSLIGFVIGHFSDNEGIAILFSLLISFPLMLLSGIFSPVQTMPSVFQYLAKMLPLSYQIDATKSVLLFGGGISNTWLYLSGALFAISYFFVSKKS